MVRKPTKRSVRDEFRAERGQSEAPPKPSEPRQRKSNTYSPYEAFLARYNHMDETVLENFSTRDLVYYFREVAQQNGSHYTIANIQKEMAIMKRVRENYSNKEICAMIEFLFTSGQDYIDPKRATPSLLVSNWVNTIYPDTMLWIDDQYVPKSAEKSSKRKKSQHEWDKQSDDDSQIGVKL